jgi:hypothetical protein
MKFGTMNQQFDKISFPAVVNYNSSSVVKIPLCLRRPCEGPLILPAIFDTNGIANFHELVVRKKNGSHILTIISSKFVHKLRTVVWGSWRAASSKKDSRGEVEEKGFTVV